MSKQLPKQPSLEHLKNEAKNLLRELKKADSNTRLANAQLDLAREYGFASWSKLKRAVEGFADQRSALFAAIRAGDRERAREVLAENPSLVAAYDPNSFGARPVPAAAHRNDRKMIELLLEFGADIDARSDWWAGSFGALDFAEDEVSRFLLSRGATLTPHAAARLGMADELRALIKSNPDVVHERGGDGQLPLHFAKTPEIVDILVDAGADIEARDLDHEGTAAQTRVTDEDVLRRLVQRGAETDIFMSIALDDLELVEKHLREDPEAIGRRVDKPGNPMIPQAPGSHIYTYNLGFVRPYQAAIKLGRDRIERFLFEQSPPKLQIVAACLKGDHAQARAVLDRYPGLLSELTNEDQLPLCEAGRTPAPDAVGVMLKVGFDVGTQDREGFTVIHWASFHGRADLIEIILPYGPDLEVKNIYGGTVLTTGMYGSQNAWWKGGDYARSTELLINAGAKLPEKIGGSPEIIEILRRHGVSS